MKSFILITPYLDKGSDFHYHKAGWGDYSNFYIGITIDAESLKKAIEKAIPLYKKGMEDNKKRLEQLVSDGEVSENKKELLLNNYPKKIRLYKVIDVDLKDLD